MLIEFGVLISAIGLLVVVIGAVIARDRQITNMIHTNHEDNTTAIATGDDKLHTRINDLRDHVTDKYVRNDHLNNHLQRIEKGVGDMRSEMREDRKDTNSRLDAVLAAISKK